MQPNMLTISYKLKTDVIKVYFNTKWCHSRLHEELLSHLWDE